MRFFTKINLISRLSVNRKFILIYALDLSAVIFVSTILINEKFISIDFARKEIVGNYYIAAVRDAAFSIKSAEKKAGEAAELVQEAEDRFGVMLGNNGSRALAQALAEQMRGLQSSEPSASSSVNAVAVALQTLITHIGNQSNLILDPDLDSYYTMSLVVIRFPELYDLIDRIGEKAYEAGNAAESEKNQRQTEYLILEGKLDAISSGINSDYGEAMQAGTAELRAEFEPSRQSLLATINSLRSSSRQIVINRQLTTESATLQQIIAASRLALHKAWQQTGASLNDLLQKRIDGFFQRMWWHFGTTVILLLVILCLVFYIARQIALPLRHLSKIAGKVRTSGDYTMQATWRSFDEIGCLVADFNTMLEQLNHSRVIEKEMEAQARGGQAQRELLEAVPIPLMVTSIPKHEVLHANGTPDWGPRHESVFFSNWRTPGRPTNSRRFG
jgi:nitrogen fixation/metabolism regulation signal transduction histidine kinase